MSGCRLGVLAGLFVLVAQSLAAQQGSSSVRGRAIDEQGAALPGVSITVTHQDTGIFRTTVSGGDGGYIVLNLVPGSYRINAELQGFRKASLSDIVLTANATQTQNIALQIGGLEESVTVSGQAPQVDVTSVAVAANVSLREIQAMPSAVNNVIGLVQVVPGVVYLPGAKQSTEAIAVNGQNGTNHWYIDGGNVTLGTFACCAARVFTPTDVIQEVGVITSQIPAEYGGRTGAVINTITRQGTNALHGGFHSFYSNQNFISRNYFSERDNLTKSNAQLWQYGGSVGGPLVHNKVFFFGAAERDSRGRNLTFVFPTATTKNFTTNAVTDSLNLFGRIDHQINANNIYSFRYMDSHRKCGDPTSCRAANTILIATAPFTSEATGYDQELDSLFVANYNRVISARKLNVVTVSSPTQFFLQTGPTGLDARDMCEGNGSRCLAPTLRYLSYDDQVTYMSHFRSEPQVRLEDAFSWFIPGTTHGSHDLKFGAMYNYLASNQTLNDAENGIFQFSRNTPFNAADPSTYPELLRIRTGPLHTYIPVQSWALYAQDKWELTSQMTLNLGLRYDQAIVKTPNGFNPLFANRSEYPTDRNNFGPRLGLAYSSLDKKAVIRGGYGVLYMTPWMNGFLDNIFQLGPFGTGFPYVFPLSGVADPGPSAGRLPTEPLLAKGPFIDHAVLDALFPAGALLRNTSTVYLDNPDRRNPTFQQITGGYEREISNGISFKVDYVGTRGRNISIAYDLNPALRVNTTRTGAVTRTDLLGLANQLGITPFSGSVFTYKSVGTEHFDGLTLSMNRRFASFWSARASYTFSRCRNNTDAGSNFQVQADQHLELGWGPCGQDRPHAVSVSGETEIPKTGGLRFTGTFRATSGTPMTIRSTNVDADRNGILFDPLPAGTYSGVGVDAITVDNKGDFNGARGPGFGELDFRLGYRFRLRSGSSVDVNLEGYNLTNEPNFGNPTVDQRLPDFLLLTSLVGGGLPRQYQVNMRLIF